MPPTGAQRGPSPSWAALPLLAAVAPHHCSRELSPRGPASYHLATWHADPATLAMRCAPSIAVLTQGAYTLQRSPEVNSKPQGTTSAGLTFLTGRLLEHARLVPRASFFYA